MASLVKPKGWGDDELSRFLVYAQNNTLSTFNNFKGSYLHLNDINNIAHGFREALANTPKWFVAFFFLRAHASFLSGVRMAMSGQVPDTFLAARSCLEAALYGYFLDQQPEHQETWLKRHDDVEAKRKCRRTFQMKEMQDVLNENEPELGRVFTILYDDSIDMGAHPNERGILLSADFDRRGDEIDIEFEFLSTDRTKLELAMRFVAQAGVCSLKIFRLLYKERLDLALLTEKLNKVTVGL